MRHFITKSPAQVRAASLPEERTEKASIFLSALFAASLGAFLVYGAGIASSDTLHNAAHDSRHAFGFSCH